MDSKHIQLQQQQGTKRKKTSYTAKHAHSPSNPPIM